MYKKFCKGIAITCRPFQRFEEVLRYLYLDTEDSLQRSPSMRISEFFRADPREGGDHARSDFRGSGEYEGRVRGRQGLSLGRIDEILGSEGGRMNTAMGEDQASKAAIQNIMAVHPYQKVLGISPRSFSQFEIADRKSPNFDRSNANKHGEDPLQ